VRESTKLIIELQNKSIIELQNKLI